MRSIATVGCLAGLLALSAPSAGMAQDEAPATGFAVWVRTAGGSLQDFTASAFGAPQFTIGYRGAKVAFGAGVGLASFVITDKNTFGGRATTDKLSGTLFQIGPSALIDVWRSPDGRVRGNLALGASLGRLSITDRNEFIDFTGNLQSNENKTTGALLSLNAGLGGDYFLHRHFALGVEAGLKGTFALGIEDSGASTSSLGLGANGAYGALRAMIVF